ncbi:MAG: glutaredoxin family protein [Candidatus Bathyarchaeia archaeon]
MFVKVYTQQHCPNCEELKNFLKNEGISFIERNIDLDKLAQKRAIEIGVCKVTDKKDIFLCSTPAVEIGDKVLFGFTEETIKELRRLK